MKKEYSNGDVTVVWQPDKCIHSAICANGLPEVFQPKDKPWIKADNASAEAIINQVKQCPSGALSYYTAADKQESKTSENMSDTKTKAQVIANGPLMVSGDITVEHADGKTETKKSAAFCRCGHSANKPFCDGSHTKQDFKG